MNIFGVMKKYILTVILLIVINYCFAQPSFMDYQKSFPTVSYASRLKEDTLAKQFAKMGLQWPPKQIYIRSFKYDSQMEVWVRNNDTDPYKLFKTYKICALAGTLGPKRIEGDYQVPEGFYYISQFDPKSEYHLALKINYPNPSDKMLSDSLRPGGGIFIHGSCVTVGCIPITDPQIEELYLLAAGAKNSGQDFIPVHIFPVRFNNPKSMDYLAQLTKDDQDVQHFETNLKQVYDYFEKEKQLPVITVNKKGEYVFL